LATFGESHVFFGFAEWEGGFFAATAAFIEVDGLFEGFLALWMVQIGWREGGVGEKSEKMANDWSRQDTHTIDGLDLPLNPSIHSLYGVQS